MQAYKPEDVLANFVEVVKHAAPKLYIAVSLITPWALLITAITEHVWVLKVCEAARSKIMSYFSA